MDPPSSRVRFSTDADRPTPRTARNRGCSLRRQLFFRNTAANTNAPTAPGEPNGLELAIMPSPEEFTKPETSEATAVPPQKTRRWNVDWVQLRKTILRQKDIPRTKDGRRIPLGDAPDDLLDERTGAGYCSNTIRSSRYTMWNFLPKQLFAQFSKLANFYFLCVSILQMIPTLSTTGTYTTIVPLLFFISLSMFKEGYDDYRRYKMDKSENGRDAQVLSRNRKDCEDEWKMVKWHRIKVGDVIRLVRDDWVPADLLLLHSDGDHGIAYIETMALDGETNLKSKQALPVIAEHCDTTEKLAAFRSEIVVEDPNADLYNFEGKVVVEGETKPLTNGQIIYRGSVLRNTPSMAGLVIFSGEESKIRMNANKNPRTKAPAFQTLLNRIVILVVVFVILLAVGCSVAYQFWRRDVEYKSWFLEDGSVPFFPVFASYVIMYNTLIPLSLYVSLEIVKLGQMWLLNDIEMYHEETDTPFEAHTSTINEDCGQVSYIFSDKTGTLTDNSMLFRKMSVGGQAWLHDLDIQDQAEFDAARAYKVPKQKIKCRGKGKSCKPPKKSHTVALDNIANGRKSFGDLASPRARKQRQKLSLDGVLAKQASSDSLRSRWRSSAVPKRPQPQLSTFDLLEYLQSHPHTFFARKARFFLLSIALCHTCLPEISEEDGSINYQAASPDELALVRAAQELGYITVDRKMDTITIKAFPNGPFGEPLTEVYGILEVIEFSSKRKRMSILVRFPNGKICIFCKGADSTMIELLKLRELAAEKQKEIDRRASIRRSIEAQEIIRRNSMQRQSIGGRSSFGGPSRASMNLGRLKPIKDDLTERFRDKEDSISLSDLDDNSLYSRPSGQFAARHSIAFGDVPNSPLERDTSEDLVDDELVLDDAKVFERCFAHVNHFATEGLRTLLYGHRFLEESEYLTWKKIYAEATTSLVDRQAMIERAGEIVERDFELTGATAIEDKLQKGVPETIDKLRRAGIKLWMLTGDKRETAINIGYSCRLIKEYSALTVLDKDGVSLSRAIQTAISDIQNNTVAHSVVVVDGGTLSVIDNDETLKSLFFDLAVNTDSVICCRASPSQKASLVKTIRTKVQKSVTLAVGDGANDIAMIQEAHVGVGITGKEGLQAARVSDYSMAQFRFLLKFLLVHGRWNYIRTCKYAVATFWKELLFYLTQALFQRWNGYTGSSLYEPWSLSMFNSLFTSLPVICIGIFEQDLRPSTLLAVPELYKKGQRHGGFNFTIYLGWMFVASCQAMIAYFSMYTLYTPQRTSDNGVFAMGVLSYSTVVTVISLKLQLLEMHHKSLVNAVSISVSLFAWWTWNTVLATIYVDNTIHNMKGGILTRFGDDLNWWSTYLFAVAACLILDLTLTGARIAWKPEDVDVFREIEKDPVLRARMEREARGEDACLVDGGAGVGGGKGEVEMSEVEMMVERRFGSVKRS